MDNLFRCRIVCVFLCEHDSTLEKWPRMRFYIRIYTNIFSPMQFYIRIWYDDTFMVQNTYASAISIKISKTNNLRFGQNLDRQIQDFNLRLFSFWGEYKGLNSPQYKNIISRSLNFKKLFLVGKSKLEASNPTWSPVLLPPFVLRKLVRRG